MNDNLILKTKATKLKGEKIRIFIPDTNEVIALAKDAKIEFSAPIKDETEQVSDWLPAKHEFTGEISFDIKSNKMQNDPAWFVSLSKFPSKERKSMLHAITHGKAILFYYVSKPEDVVNCAWFTQPKVLRSLFRLNHGLRFDYLIVSIYYCKQHYRKIYL